MVVEGIFRLSAAVRDVEKLKEQFEKKKTVNLHTELPKNSGSAHIVATLLKMYVRDLSVPVLTHDMYDIFIAIAGSIDFFFLIVILVVPSPLRTISLLSLDGANSLGWTGWVPDCMKRATAMLPPGSKLFVKKLFRLLNRVSKHSTANKMTATNIAICFGPSMLKSKTDSIATLLGDAGRANRCVATFVEHYDELMEV